MFMIRSYHAADPEATTHWAIGLKWMSLFEDITDIGEFAEYTGCDILVR
jgi:hypothetical protein